MPPHPKPAVKAKKPGAMRSSAKPKKGYGPVTETEKVAIAARVAAKDPTPKPKRVAKPKADSGQAPPVKAEAKPAAPEGSTKTDMLLGMLKRDGGATSKEMEEATGWAPHSVRGLLGTLRKKGVAVTSTKLKGEATIYRIAASVIGDVV